ncbi:MAG: CDP-alcohol phosphatidyltransferase family protein [Actinomycetota bacterium]|nr:MAG: CDP-alcohol phosphatidyltransferase family protein [Actinomycetota bacterium]
MRVQPTAVQTTRVLTVPNLLSLLRLLAIPLFLVLLARQADGVALAVLVLSAATDWLDGVLARRLHQISALGQVLDPLVDRLWIAATLVGLALRQIVPWWVVVALLGRDLVLLTLLPALRRRGLNALPVHFLGKLATFLILAALPLLLFATWGLGGGPDGSLAVVARAFGWALLLWGTALYWYAGILYVVQARRLFATVAART